MVRFIYGTPGAVFKDTLIVADIHVGVESETIPEFSLERCAESAMRGLEELIERAKVGRLLILGDIKHAIMGGTEEAAVVRDLLTTLGELVDIIIVKGNHDGGIERMLKGMDLTIAGPEGLVMDGVGFFHGHSWPSEEVMKCDEVMTGHMHPCVELEDGYGYKMRKRVWVVGGFHEERVLEKYHDGNPNAKLTIVPAFNEKVGCYPVNSGSGSPLIGPAIKRMFKMSDAKIYLLDGTPLGKVRQLRR